MFLSVTQSFAESNERKPNVIVILADDLGYGDLSCYGADDIATPNIDCMASEGMKFNSFYVSPVCSPTRAALMTGSHSTRVGISGVLFPRNNHGLNPNDITLPEILKTQGYATAIIGKWHLGNQDMFQPLNHGFDYWYGTQSSNSQGFYPDSKQYAPVCVFREDYSIPADTESDEAITCIDLLPTLIKLAGGKIPSDRVIDGKDIWPLLAGKPNAKSPHEAIFYLRGRGAQPVRVGDWKYLVEESLDNEETEDEVELTEEEQKLPRKERNALIKERRKAASPKQESSVALYNFKNDLGEKENLISKHPEIVVTLRTQIESFHQELRKNIRPAGVANQTP